jgi:hypothetical protein
MHGYHNLPLVPLLMLTMIDATTLLHEPFSECGAFHCSTLALSDLKRCSLPPALIIAPNFLPRRSIRHATCCGSRQALDVRVVRRACEELGLDPAQLPGPKSRA